MVLKGSSQRKRAGGQGGQKKGQGIGGRGKARRPVSEAEQDIINQRTQLRTRVKSLEKERANLPQSDRSTRPVGGYRRRFGDSKEDKLIIEINSVEMQIHNLNRALGRVRKQQRGQR